MKGGALGLGLWLAAVAGAAADPVRLATREALRGWEPVGRVEIGETGYCTGTLIAPDLVLTAASCVIAADGTPVDAGKIRFRAGLIEGVAVAESTITRTLVAEGYRRIDPVPAAMIARDVALLELATPVPSALIPAFALALPDRDQDLEMAYYAEGGIEAPMLQAGCVIEVTAAAIFGLDCGPAAAALGAPVFQRAAYRVRVVGIASAQNEDGGRTILLAMELPDQVARLEAALRRGDATSRAAAVPPGVKRIKPGQGSDSGAKFLSP